MDRKWKTGLVGGMALAVALAGCVDEKPSVVMYGSVVGSGSVEIIEEEVPEEDVGDDENGEEEEVSVESIERASCDLAPEFDEPEIHSRGFVNLTELALVGQPAVEGSYAGARPGQYYFGAVFENRLHDSRTVGAVSGGDGGGFENLTLDKNDVLIRWASVEFPADANTYVDEEGNEEPFFDGDHALEHDRLTTMLVQSGGGVATLWLPLISGFDELEDLETYIDVLPRNWHTYVVRIQLHGETLGGEIVESNSIDYPIDMCSVDWIDVGMLAWTRNDWQDWFSDPTGPGWDMGAWEDFFGDQIEGETAQQREDWVLAQIDTWGATQWEAWITEQHDFLGATSWREWTDEQARDWLVDRSVEHCGPTLHRCSPD